MSHRPFASIVLVSLLASLIPIQTRADAIETVFLKDAGRVRGEILELRPGKFVTLKTVTGEVRTIDWSQVERVGDASKAPVPGAEQSSESPSGGEGEATLVVRSTRPGAMISRVTGHSMATGYGYGRSVVVAGVSWVDLCTAPCEYKLPAGLVELRLSGDGITPTTAHFNLQAGVNRIVAKSGSSTTYALGYVGLTLGLTALLVGGALWGVGSLSSSSIGSGKLVSMGQTVTLIGVPLTGLGIWGVVAGSSSLEKDSDQAARLPAPPLRGVSFAGTF
ncbi:MAG: hypothetical protein RMJ98_16120 [Myxococcales bacterium]|nr:hypothetical protein [Polyangiaceae bacterium]MDW8250824.1 hypothetical protein [Myxococcales bacterium]